VDYETKDNLIQNYKLFSFIYSFPAETTCGSPKRKKSTKYCIWQKKKFVILTKLLGRNLQVPKIFVYQHFLMHFRTKGCGQFSKCKNLRRPISRRKKNVVRRPNRNIFSALFLRAKSWSTSIDTYNAVQHQHAYSMCNVFLLQSTHFVHV
jgi:hypothetical protein